MQRAHALVDDDLAAVEVGVVPLEPGEFAPAHAGVGGGDDQHRVLRGHPGGQSGDLFGAGVGAFGSVAGVDAELAAGVGAEQTFIDSSAEDHRQQSGDIADAFLGEGGAQCFTQALAVIRCTSPSGMSAKRGRMWLPRWEPVGVPSDGADLVGLRPHLNPLAHGRLGEAGVDEEFSSLIGLYVRCALLGIRPAGEAGSR